MYKRTPPPTYLEVLTNELLAKYRKLDSVITHAPTKGSYHEKILREVIRNYLPSSFSTGEGFIINGEGNTSTQMDILVVDNLDPRSFGYKEGDFYIASDLAMACFGEVKTYCTKREFISSFHNLVSAKLLVRDEDVPARITSFIFCYDANASSKSFSKWVDAAIESFPNRQKTKQWHYPDYAFCLKKNVFLERRPVEGGFQYFTATDSSGKSSVIQQLMLQKLFGCVTSGCGRLRDVQGISLFRVNKPDISDFL